MILAALLVPVAAALLVLLVQYLRLPIFLSIMAVALAYGLAAGRTIQSVGRAFDLGFVTALEQVGLLVMAGALVGVLLVRRPLSGIGSGVAGVLAGLGGSAAGGLALLQPAGTNAPRRAIGIAFTLLAVHALVAPSPLAVAAASVMKADIATALAMAAPVALIAAAIGWLYLRTCLPADSSPGTLSWAWLAVAIPLALLIVQAVAQMPAEPLGRGAARAFYAGLSQSLPLAVLALALALLLSRRWQPAALTDTSWAPLLLAVGAAGGLGRVLDGTGMAELLAERVLDSSLGPHLGLLAPFLAAAIAKTLQGNSLTAVLTASGMVEPMLPSLGLDGAAGRALAAAAVGAGSMAICHVNDPFFWIAAHMGGLTPAKALRVISLGSLAMAVAALLALAALRLLSS